MRLIISSMAIVSVLFVLMSVRVAADDRTQELVKQARAAIGGEQALGTVRSLSLVGKLRRDDDQAKSNSTSCCPTDSRGLKL